MRVRDVIHDLLGCAPDATVEVRVAKNEGTCDEPGWDDARALRAPVDDIFDAEGEGCSVVFYVDERKLKRPQ